MAQPALIDSFAMDDAAAARPRTVSEESKRSFLRMVSHELRTPLNAIIGFSEILAHELCGPLGSPQYKEYAGLIGESGHKLLKLVNQIMEIVRLEGGAADLDIRPEPLQPLIEDALHQLRDDAAAARVTFVFKAPEGLPDVQADARAAQSVLLNLLQNALAYSPAGGQIAVRAYAAGGKARIEIKDQGPGVAAADIERIMRPFEQGEHVLTRHSEGAGLGLPITRLLCEAMAGALELRSTVGRGVTATVILPAA